MRKLSIGLEELELPRPSRRLPRRVVAITLAALVAPFVYESVAICVGNWRAAMGASSDVPTPVLDASLGILGRIRDEFAGLILPTFQHIPWQPSHVLVVAAVAMTASMLMLRR
jgi:hypothetical protein